MANAKPALPDDDPVEQALADEALDRAARDAEADRRRFGPVEPRKHRFPLRPRGRETVFIGIRVAGHPVVLRSTVRGNSPFPIPLGADWGPLDGAYDLATAILLSVTDIQTTRLAREAFTQQVIAAMPSDGFELSVGTIRRWLGQQLDPEKEQSMSHRLACPRCRNGSLETDYEDGVYRCINCGRSWDACPQPECPGLISQGRCNRCDYGDDKAVFGAFAVKASPIGKGAP